jgi:hypothetical protein
MKARRTVSTVSPHPRPFSPRSGEKGELPATVVKAPSSVFDGSGVGGESYRAYQPAGVGDASTSSIVSGTTVSAMASSSEAASGVATSPVWIATGAINASSVNV